MADPRLRFLEQVESNAKSTTDSNKSNQNSTDSHESSADSSADSTNSHTDSHESAVDSNDYGDLDYVDIGTSTIRAKAEFETYQSGNQIGRETLDSNPSGNGDIGSILRILPNVQFDNAQNRSTTPGEIDPADISISGGLYYQNNFQLDGFNINNDLDPANSMGNPSLYNAVPGKSQGLNVDTSLLDSITVLDSNVGASYGGFTGGVVEANTKRASKKIGANISYQITQGNANPKEFSLTQYHIYAPTSDDYADFLDSSTASNQPQFTKHSVRASLESKFHEKAGIVASFSTMQSFIPLVAWNGNYKNPTDDAQKIQKRQSYNLFLKGHYDALDNLMLEASYAFMPQYNNYFRANVKDSYFDFQTGGHNVGLKTIWGNEMGDFDAQIGFSYMQGSRANAEDTLRNWYYSQTKNWTQYRWNSEGSYGNADTKQLNANLKANQKFKPIKLGHFEHTFNIGAEVGYVNSFYERKKDAIWSGTTTTAIQPLAVGQICLDTFWCDNGKVDINYLTASQKRQDAWINNNGQYFARVSMLQAGKINLDNLVTAGWLEDNIKFYFGEVGEINARFGMRKATFAPRFSLNYIASWSEWEIGKNFATQLTFGANRYYGRNLFAYKLMEGRSAFQWELRRTDYTMSWYDSAVTKTQTRNDTEFNQLKVPYSDELMGGIVQRFYMFDISAKYIYRAGKDEITTKCAQYNTSGSCIVKTYDNLGGSKSDIISVSIQNNGGLDFGGVKNYILFAFDWTNVKRNYSDYTDTMLENPDIIDEWISYNGTLMRFIDLPADNFVRPYTFRLTTTHAFKVGRTKWQLNNFFRIRSPYYAMVSVAKDSYCENNPTSSFCVGQPIRDKFDIDGDGVEEYIDTYRPFRVPFSFTWDMRIGFEIDIYGGNTLYANVDIFNVLNRKNLAITSFSGVSAQNGYSKAPYYEIGRQFWFEIGYKF